MRVPTRLSRLAFAAAGVFVLAPLASAGHVTFMEPARYIQARLTEEYEQQDGSVDRAVDEEMANSSGLGPFDEEVVARIEPPRDPLGNAARVSQRSTVGRRGSTSAGDSAAPPTHRTASTASRRSSTPPST